MGTNLRDVVPLSAIGLGCSRVGSFSNATPRSEIRATLRAALDLGITVFDTADIYGQGDSELELGEALRGRRHGAFVITKLGKVFSSRMRALRVLKPIVGAILPAALAGRTVSARRARAIAHDFTPARFASAADASLRRLGFDHVDGLLLHSPPAAVVRDPEVGAALAALAAAGQVRAFGGWCAAGGGLAAARAMPGRAMLQLTLPVLDEAIARGLWGQIRANGVIVFAREVIQRRAGLSVREAVASATARAEVDCVIVGASRRTHLQGLLEAASA